MGIYDKTIELLETLSPFSCVFLPLHLHAVTNRNVEMHGVRRFTIFHRDFSFSFCYFYVLGCFRWKEKEK
jgi:hypothetical protein